MFHRSVISRVHERFTGETAIGSGIKNSKIPLPALNSLRPLRVFGRRSNFEGSVDMRASLLNPYSNLFDALADAWLF